MDSNEWVLNHEALTGLWAHNLVGVKVAGQWTNPDIALVSRPDLVTVESDQLKLQAIESNMETMTWRFRRL